MTLGCFVGGRAVKGHFFLFLLTKDDMISLLGLNLTKECDCMRKCLRCETAMVEDLAVMVTNAGYGIDVREKGRMFKGFLGRIKCAVCPECGYTETYIDNPENIKKLSEKNK